MGYNLSTRDVPRPDNLSEEGLDAIHETAIQIIEDIGINVAHEEGRRVLEENGANVDHDDEMVWIPRSLVEDAVETAPSDFTLHGRGEGREVHVGGDDYALASAYGAPNILTYDEGRRRSTIEDYELLAKLAQSEDIITVTGYNLCEPNDVRQEVKHYEMIKRSLTLTDKPVMGSVYGEDRAKASLEMVGIANDARDLSRPYVAGVVNSVSPRQWDTKMTGGLLEYAKHGQPVLISPAVMANASGPSTLAGSLALANAEILTGITMTQLVNPGTPIVYGLPSSNVDIRNGSFAIGSPEGALFVTFAAQAGRYYDVPSRAGGTLTDAKTVDDQSGAEAMMQMMVTMQSGINYVLHAAGILGSYSAMSPEKYVLDAERIRYIQRFLTGYDLNEDTFALDLIEEVEPGGHFLNKRHTLEHGDTDHYMTDIFNRQSYDDWESAGEPDSFELAHERVNELVDSFERPPLDSDLKSELDDYVAEGREVALN